MSRSRKRTRPGVVCGVSASLHGDIGVGIYPPPGVWVWVWVGQGIAKAKAKDCPSGRRGGEILQRGKRGRARVHGCPPSVAVCLSGQGWTGWAKAKQGKARIPHLRCGGARCEVATSDQRPAQEKCGHGLQHNYERGLRDTARGAGSRALRNDLPATRSNLVYGSGRLHLVSCSCVSRAGA